MLGKDVREIEQWPSDLLSEWLAYDSLDKIPDPYWIGGQICQVIAACFAGKKTEVSDWIPRVRPAPRIMTGEHGRAIIDGIRAQMLAQQATQRRDQFRAQGPDAPPP